VIRKRLVLRLSSGAAPSLRAIGAKDLEDLRYWKNANRHAFFTKKELTPADQSRWYAGYTERPDDWMFVVEDGALRAGCLGFRVEDAGVDVYNVIAAPEARGKGLMKTAMRLLCSYIRERRGARIEAKVVRGNPALEWYKSCGFEPAAEMREYTLVSLGPRFQPLPYVEEGE
jgi:RimJ/RimL family protein N-acetyltransferase